MSENRSLVFETEVTVTILPGVDVWWYTEERREPEWRGDVYGLKDEDAIYWHWCWNAIKNGVRDASELDGWADLPRGAVTFEIATWSL